MADRYIDEAYIRARLGDDFVVAIAGIDGISTTGQIESATASVQAILRAAGYTPPVTTDPTTVEELIKLAVLWRLWTTMAHVPEASVSLPDNYKEHPAYEAYHDLKDGSAQPTLTPTNIAAVGGWKASEHRQGYADSYPQRASRSELKGW